MHTLGKETNNYNPIYWTINFIYC